MDDQTDGVQLISIQVLPFLSRATATAEHHRYDVTLAIIAQRGAAITGSSPV